MQSTRLTNTLLALLALGVWGLFVQQMTLRTAEAQPKAPVAVASKTTDRWAVTWKSDYEEIVKKGKEGWEPFGFTFREDSLYVALRKRY